MENTLITFYQHKVVETYALRDKTKAQIDAERRVGVNPSAVQRVSQHSIHPTSQTNLWQSSLVYCTIVFGPGFYVDVDGSYDEVMTRLLAGK